MALKRTRTIVVLLMIAALSGCGTRETPEQRHSDANTPAGKLGQAAHKAAVEADKAGQVIGKQLRKAAHDAREGWKEAARNDQSKK